MDDYHNKFAQQNMAMGVLTPGPMSDEEYQKQQHEAAVQQAIYILEQARQYRLDAALMAEVRVRIRKMRDEGAALLDDIGD